MDLSGHINRKLKAVHWDFHVDDDNPLDAKFHGMKNIPADKMQYIQARTHSAHQ